MATGRPCFCLFPGSVLSRSVFFTLIQISDHVGLLAGEATGKTHLHRAGGETGRPAAGQRATGDKLTMSHNCLIEQL